MAFDGFTTAALAEELSDRLTGARVFRVIMPENDELLLTFRCACALARTRLFRSAI